MNSPKILVKFLPFLALSALLSGIAAQSVPYQWQNVGLRGGGFIPGLVFSPVAKGMLYARTDMATAYRWDDVHSSWIPLMDWLSKAEFKYIGVEAIAADPVDSNTVYMAVGTYTSGGNGAIIKSTNRGVSWTWETIGAPMGGNGDGRSAGERLMIDPNNNKVLFFGSRTTGLWKSPDAGVTWNKVAGFPTTGNSGYGLTFVVFDKTSGTPGKGSSTLYVGVFSTAAGSNLYKSTDSGVTWAVVPAGTGGGPTGQMPIHATFGPNHVLWLAYNNGPPPSNSSSGAVWKYAPATGAWTNVNPAGHGGGIGGVSVSATDSNFAICSTIDWWNPDEIYRTTNGGTTWTGIAKGAQHNMNGAEYLCFGPPGCATPSSNGWDGDIQIDPFNEARVFHTTGQGAWCSVNDTAAAAQVVWTFVQKNFEETVGMDLTSSVKKSLFMSCGDVGIQRFPTDSLDTPSVHGMVTNPLQTNGGSVDFAGLNPNIVVDNGSGGDGCSFDNGITWTKFGTGGAGNVAVSASGATFVASESYSVDSGKTWKASTGLPSGARICSDRVNPNKFYAFSGGTLYASTNGAVSFAAATSGLAGTGRASAVFGLEGEVWVAAGANLYHSSSSGANATKVASVAAVTSVGYGKAAPGATYPTVYIIGTVGSATGVFRSIDEGNTWVQVNDSLHQYGEMDNVAGDEDYYGRVYVTTQGRGIPYGQPLSTSVAPDAGHTFRQPTTLKLSAGVISSAAPGPMVLFDVMGRAIRYGKQRDNRIELPLAGLGRGVYIARQGSSVLRIAL
jgi:hypothetical protein